MLKRKTLNTKETTFIPKNELIFKCRYKNEFKACGRSFKGAYYSGQMKVE